MIFGSRIYFIKLFREMIPPNHHFDLTSEGALLPKEILLELILNRHSEKLEANPHSLLARRSFKIKINRPLLTDSSRSEEMDFDEVLPEVNAASSNLRCGEM